MVSLVNSHTNATRIGWHLWEIDLRFAPGLGGHASGPREWLVFKAHRLVYHSTLGSRVITKRRRRVGNAIRPFQGRRIGAQRRSVRGGGEGLGHAVDGRHDVDGARFDPVRQSQVEQVQYFGGRRARYQRLVQHHLLRCRSGSSKASSSVSTSTPTPALRPCPDRGFPSPPGFDPSRGFPRLVCRHGDCARINHARKVSERGLCELVRGAETHTAEAKPGGKQPTGWRRRSLPASAGYKHAAENRSAQAASATIASTHLGRR